MEAGNQGVKEFIFATELAGEEQGTCRPGQQAGWAGGSMEENSGEPAKQEAVRRGAEGSAHEANKDRSMRCNPKREKH